MKAGIYIHIPFCREKCDYCSFFSVPIHNDTGKIRLFINSLRKEINCFTAVENEIEADTVYFGGGTPSILDPSGIEEILNCVAGRFRFGPDPEITLEMNPDDLGKEKLEGYLHAGINRIVLGVQSLDSIQLKKIGRRGRTVRRDDLELFFSSGGFIRCIDIIAGIPGQTKTELHDDLDVVCAYRPEHISLYLLSVEKNTPFGRRFNADDIFEKDQAELWEYAMNFLAEKGYNHYEISNYAIPGYESRHNSKYWDFSPYIGFGPGSHSYINKTRYSNSMGITEYMSADEFVYDIDPGSINNRIVEFIMTSMRRVKGFTEEEFTAATGIPLPDEIAFNISLLKSEGMVCSDNTRHFLSGEGLFFADRVIYRIVENLL